MDILYRIGLIAWSLRDFLAADRDSADWSPATGSGPTAVGSVRRRWAHRDGPTADEFKPMGAFPKFQEIPAFPKKFSGIFSGGLFRARAI